MVTVADQAFHVYKAYNNRHQSEQGQENFSETTAKLQPVSHAFILNKVNVEPVGENSVLLG